MNGRVYDPLVARFLSGDPLIQDPVSGQSYNRYSYVLNNPTNLVDPTGYCNEKTDGKGCAQSLEEWVKNFKKSLVGKTAEAADAAVAAATQIFKDQTGGDKISAKNHSANSGTPNQPEKNHGDHWAEYKRDIPSSGGDGPATNATGYDDWARGKGYMTQEQWNERAAARGAGAAIGVGIVATGAVVVEAPAIGAGIAAGFKRLFGLGKVEVQFGRVENQVNHTFRHIDKAGLDRNAVQQAVRQDVSRAAESLSKGQQHTGSVVVNGTRVEYSAFKLQDGTINVGRITPPRP